MPVERIGEGGRMIIGPKMDIKSPTPVPEKSFEPDAQVGGDDANTNDDGKTIPDFEESFFVADELDFVRIGDTTIPTTIAPSKANLVELSFGRPVEAQAELDPNALDSIFSDIAAAKSKLLHVENTARSKSSTSDPASSLPDSAPNMQSALETAGALTAPRPNNNAVLSTVAPFQFSAAPVGAGKDSAVFPEPLAGVITAIRNTIEVKMIDRQETRSVDTLSTGTISYNSAESDASLPATPDQPEALAINSVLETRSLTTLPTNFSESITGIPKDLAQNLARQIGQVLVSSNENVVEIRLDPPELGKVKINMEMSGSSLLATIIVERSDVSDLMRRHSESLVHELGALGFDQVKLDFRSGQNQPQQHQSAQSGPTYFEPFKNESAQDLELLAESGHQNTETGLDVRL